MSPNTKSSYILSTECSTCWPTWEICSRRPLVLCYNSHSIVRPISRSIIHLHSNIQKRQSFIGTYANSSILSRGLARNGLLFQMKQTTSRNKVNGQSPVKTNFLEKRCTRMQMLSSLERTFLWNSSTFPRLKLNSCHPRNIDIRERIDDDHTSCA